MSYGLNKTFWNSESRAASSSFLAKERKGGKNGRRSAVLRPSPAPNQLNHPSISKNNYEEIQNIGVQVLILFRLKRPLSSMGRVDNPRK